MRRDPEDRRMLGVLLGIPFQALAARVQQGLAAAGYTDLRPAQFAVFRHMAPEGVRLTELAEAAQITKQSMGYLVDYLEAQGYVERVADPGDGRAKVICLSQRGREVERIAREVIARVEGEWARRLGEQRMDQFRAILKDLAAMLEE